MKKSLSLIAVLAMLVACMIPATFAAETIAMEIGNVSIEKGEGTVVVEVPVSTVDIGVAGGDFFDITVSEGATLKGVKMGGLTAQYNDGKGFMMDFNGMGRVDVTGVLFYILVEIPADTYATYEVKIGSGNATSVESNVTDAAISFTKGSVTVKHDCVAGEAVKENEVAPTCEKAGGYDLVVYCTLCGEEMSREHVEVAALGHAWDNGVLPETYDCDDVLKTYTCERCDATKTEDASHEHVMAAYAISDRTAEDGSYYVTYQDKCTHAADHGCTEVGETYEKLVTGPITGDITPYIAMGVLTMVALVSAAAYMLLKRKAI